MIEARGEKLEARSEELEARSEKLDVRSSFWHFASLRLRKLTIEQSINQAINF